MENLKQKLKNLISDLKNIPNDAKSRKILYFFFFIFIFQSLIMALPNLGLHKYACLVGFIINCGYVFSQMKYGVGKIRTKVDFISIFTNTAANIAYTVGFFSN